MDNKMDKVSFRGIKNTGGCIFVNHTHVRLRLVTQLTNHFPDDLVEFKEILKRFPDPLGKKFLKIDCIEKIDDFKMPEAFLVNGKLLEVSDKNLSTFSKLTKLLKRIQNKEKLKIICEEERFIPVNKKYLESSDLVKNYSLEPTPIVTGDNKKKLFYHDPRRVINTAEQLEERIQIKMEEYLVQEKAVT